mgnify:CR=1 FL=1
MREVEGFLGVEKNHEEHRKGLISAIAAWAIDHPGERVIYQSVFPDLVKKLHDAVFAERKKPVAMLVRDLVSMLRETEEKGDKEPDLGDQRRREASAMLERLRRMGYEDKSAKDAALAMLRHRMADAIQT